ncbi:CPBP family intramembrane glutamic endopeptidase [Corynebacterium sp. Marseille-P4321]|uniref:CPBP family intramembrane glutamic endopeptidase n=1 Tax=Corynebacterium sp. Marseille-P4321 TaxID=2736603 RepID=UPI001589D571|nr:CPBP family intramembrane glutamic endopeptidase [Corynebacterium sp. Marseille-P4321]
MNTAVRPLKELGWLALCWVAFTTAASLLMQPPHGLLRPLLVVACALPAPFIAARAAGRHERDVLGPARRVRWDVLTRSLVVAALVYGALGLWRYGQGPGGVDKQMLLVLAIVPLQAAAEEAVFRGALPQIIGAWVRAPLVAYGLPALLFSLGHGDVLGALAFGACAAALAWYTGGLEASFALHVGANLAFYLPIYSGAPVHLGPDTLAAVVAAGGTAAWLWASKGYAQRNGN